MVQFWLLSYDPVPSTSLPHFVDRQASLMGVSQKGLNEDETDQL